MINVVLLSSLCDKKTLKNNIRYIGYISYIVFQNNRL